MKLYELARNSSNTLDQLAEIRMNPSGGHAAKACLRQLELLAGVLMRVDAGLRRVVGFAGQCIRVLACRAKVRAAIAEPN